MEWNELYGKSQQPDLKQMEEYIGSPLWGSIREFLETEYKLSPSVEHSRCSGKPGWNVKYKKGSRSACTLYPDSGFFTCLVSIGKKEAVEAEFLLTACTPYIRDLYAKTTLFNGGRWLMIDVTDEDILEDTKNLISTRIGKKKGRKNGDRVKNELDSSFSHRNL